jgi:hypothetical protein
MNLLNAWVNNTLIGLKLTFRDRQAIFWTYGFPLFFLFLYASIFARGRAVALLAMLPGLLCISAMSGGLWASRCRRCENAAFCGAITWPRSVPG